MSAVIHWGQYAYPGGTRQVFKMPHRHDRCHHSDFDWNPQILRAKCGFPETIHANRRKLAITEEVRPNERADWVIEVNVLVSQPPSLSPVGVPVDISNTCLTDGSLTGITYALTKYSTSPH